MTIGLTASDGSEVEALVEVEPSVDDAVLENDDENDLEAITETEFPNNDFCFTEADFVEFRSGMNDATLHQNRHKIAWDKIKMMEGQEIEIASSVHGKIKWKIVECVEQDEMSETIEKEKAQYEEKNFSVLKDDFESIEEAFWKMWPQSIDSDLEKLNKVINEENTLRKQRYQRVLRLVTIKEFKIFNALIIGAGIQSKQGSMLWAKSHHLKKKQKTLAPLVDFGKYMMEWRFKEIKQFIPRIMEDTTIKDTDEWYKFKKRVELFVSKNKEMYMASSIMVFDESMSAFIPRTTKTGSLPNISYVKRKPEHLGTEVKNIVDGISGNMIWIEIQEGKERMKIKEFQEFGSTTACTLRGIKDVRSFDFPPGCRG